MAVEMKTKLFTIALLAALPILFPDRPFVESDRSLTLDSQGRQTLWAHIGLFWTSHEPNGQVGYFGMTRTYFWSTRRNGSPA